MVKRQPWLVLLLVATAFQAPNLRGAASSQPRVLVLHSTRYDTQLPLLTNRDLPRILNNRLSQPVDYNAEYIDAPRMSTLRQERAFRDYVRAKYRNQRFDLVIAMQDVASDFVRKYRGALFRGTPIVFSSRNRNVPRPANSTGVVAEINLRGTLDFALTLQPETKQVFVVTGASGRDKVYENLARAQLRGFEPRVTVTYLAGLPRTELERRVAALPEASILYYLLFYQDRTGETQNPTEFLGRLSTLANRPTYSWTDSTMDHGVVGGRLEDQSSLIQAVADVAVRVLKGERADAIPVSMINTTVAQVDWRQLQRWQINASQVPEGTSVLFRQNPPNGDDVQLSALWPVPFAVVLIAAMAVWTNRRRKTQGDAHGNPFGKIRLEDRLRDLGRRLLKAQEEERSRIALELHDDVSQQAVALAIDLQRINDAAPGNAQKIVRDAQKRVKSLLKSVHDLSHRLHPANLRLVGLLGALGQLQRDLSGPGMMITVSSENVAAILPDDIALCLYRIAQEAMQNAVKHSGARNIRVQLKGENDAIALQIVDDGAGFDVDAAAAGKGLGLISMHERAESVGGTLRVVSRKGAGTRLQVTIPFRNPQRHQASSIAS